MWFAYTISLYFLFKMNKIVCASLRKSANKYARFKLIMKIFRVLLISNCKNCIRIIELTYIGEKTRLFLYVYHISVSHNLIFTFLTFKIV